MSKKKGKVHSHLKEIRKRRWKPKFVDQYDFNGKFMKTQNFLSMFCMLHFVLDGPFLLFAFF
jgi:hypothetical protein